MTVPVDRWYTEEHEWAAPGPDGAVKVGITDYAQDALGDVVYVDLPAVGKEISAGSSVAEVESTKSVAEIYAPFDGVVVTANPNLESMPELINTSPYDEGWIFLATPAGDDWQSGLLDASTYEELIGEAS